MKIMKLSSLMNLLVEQWLGRRWSDGLHQAVEAKENVPLQDESQTLASISYQNLFLLYKNCLE